MLSTVEWKSPTNKIMIGKAAASRDVLIRKTLINDKLRHGKDYQYFAILKDKDSGLVKLEPMGVKGAEVTKKFDEKTPGDPKNIKEPLKKGQNEAFIAFAEYFIKVKKMFVGPMHSEKEAGIILESEHKAHLAEIAAKRKEIA